MKIDSLLNKIIFLAYSLGTISFVLPNNISSICIIFIITASILYWAQKGITFKANELRDFLFHPILFLTLVVGITYTNDHDEGWTLIARHSSLLILPIALSSSNTLSKRQLNALFKIFITALLLVGTYSIVSAYFGYLKEGTVYLDGKSGHFIYNRFMYHNLLDPLGLHAVYMSFYITFASVIILYKLLFNNNSFSLPTVIVYIFCFLFFSILLYLLKSSMFSIVFPLACLFIVFLRLKNRLNSLSGISIFLSITIVASIFAYKGSKSKLEQFTISKDLSDPMLNPLSIRMGIWQSSLNVIQKNILTGVGTGDSKSKLRNEYHKLNFTIGIENEYNTHNMYLQYWLSNGIVALLSFIGLLVLMILKAIKNKNPLMICFILIFASFCLTESTMLRLKGNVFFIFVTTLFYWNPKMWIIQSDENH